MNPLPAPGMPDLIAVDYDPFALGELSRVVPTTEPQREIWLADQLGTDASLSFNLSVSLRLSGALDRAALAAALQSLVDRHESLRSALGPDGDVLCVRQAVAFGLQETDLSALAEDAMREAVQARLRHSVENPFRVEHDLLFRAELLRLASDEHHLVLSAHHVVCDGWSWWVIVRELGALYARHAGASARALPPAERYTDYAIAETAHPDDRQHQADEAFWLSRFADEVPVLELPTDRARPAQRSFASARVDHVLDAELTAALRRLGARRGASLFATLLAGFSGLLSRLTGQSSVVVGIPAAGQSIGGHDRLVGHCVNTLPLRFDVQASEPFGASVDAAQTVLLDALEHQRHTFGTLLKKLPIARDPSRMPLVSVLFNIDQALEGEDDVFPGLALEFFDNPRSFDTFELFVNAARMHGALRLECQYNRDLFDAATVRHWLTAYECLLRSAVEQVDQPLARMALVDGAARLELDALQPPPVAFDRECRMHEYFERQCDLTPDRIAVRFGDSAWTYAQLEARANRVAHLLRGHGVHRGSLVGLSVDRGMDMLAALLGILKSGAGYVPLDPQFPAERLAYMASDASLAALVTEREHAGHFELPDRPVLALDELGDVLSQLPDTRIGRDYDTAMPDSVAYVIYTSGSTGRPKGVQVPHSAVSNFLVGMQAEPGIGADDRLLAVTTLSFDIAVLELMLPLSVGAQVIVADRDTVVDALALAQRLADSGATMMQATPATWRLLLDAGWQGSRGFTALCGGEPMAPDLAQQLLPRCAALWNLYGPTETTVWSTCAQIEPGLDGTAPDIHIGHPIANTQIWILDEQGELCPRGVPGEICIGGEGVTLGYLQRPELNADRFIADRFTTSEQGALKLYRTGDRGRWRADGQLEHQGRMDFQVKVRGYRIELGEIEHALVGQPGVARAVVVAREDRPGDVRLVAYLVAAASNRPEDRELMTAMRELLPYYMVPQHIVWMQAIPLLPNGKIDRKSLPSPQAPAVAAVASPAAAGDAAAPPVAGAPSPPVAKQDGRVSYLVSVWSQVLGVPASAPDNFFDLGGHSMLAVQMANRVARDTGSRIRLMALATQTLEQVAMTLPAPESPAEAVEAVEAAPRDAGAATSRAPVRVQPLYFGPPQRTLFGVRHGPVEGRDAVGALVVAPPLLQEGISSHRSLWWVCEQLAATGVTSLRFDWYGSGDSAGDSRRMTFDGLAEDAAAAADWWQGRAPRRIRRLAVRSGAIGVLVAASRSPEPVDLVLWDPTLDGDRLHEEWIRMHKAQMSEVGRYPYSTAEPDDDDLLGFDTDAAFRAAVRGFDARTLPLPPGSRVLATGWEPGEGMQAWLDGLAQSGVHAEWWPLDTGDAPAWSDPAQFENQLFPRRGAAKLAARLGEAAEWA